MKDFFNPWRRKVGVVTLVVACVACMACTGSYVVAECLYFSVGEQRHNIISCDGVVAWSSFPHGRLHHWEEINRRPSLHRFSKTDPVFGEFIYMARRRMHNVPYWSIVLPLTLFSAWLLLSKPRPPAPKTTEPAPTTGARNA